MAYKFNPFTGNLDYYQPSTSGLISVTEATATRTVTAADASKIIYMTFNGDRTLTLPSNLADGTYVIVKDGGTSGIAPNNYKITLTTTGGSTIEITEMYSTGESLQITYVSSLNRWVAV